MQLHVPAVPRQIEKQVPSLGPLLHKLSLTELIPIVPQTYEFAVTAIVFLEYAPGLAATPRPQQHILPPEPPAPQISITAVPSPGDFQHT
jgi:hypothetical protein